MSRAMDIYLPCYSKGYFRCGSALHRTRYRRSAFLSGSSGIPWCIGCEKRQTEPHLCDHHNKKRAYRPRGEAHGRSKHHKGTPGRPTRTRVESKGPGSVLEDRGSQPRRPKRRRIRACRTARGVGDSRPRFEAFGRDRGVVPGILATLPESPAPSSGGPPARSSLQRTRSPDRRPSEPPLPEDRNLDGILSPTSGRDSAPPTPEVVQFEVANTYRRGAKKALRDLP